MIRSTLEHTAEIIRQRHEHPEDPARRLIQHVHEHSHDTALVAMRIAEAVDPGNHALCLVVWNAGLFHDIEHFDRIETTGPEAPLLVEKRVPISDGRAEQISAREAYQHFAGRLLLPQVCEDTMQAIDFGTRYRFTKGNLRQNLITKARNPLAAYIVAKADLLNVLLRKDELDGMGDPKKMLDISLRFLMERYPALAEHIISGQVLPDATFAMLKEHVLPAFADEEQAFLTDQYGRIEADAKGILDPNQLERVLAIFDLGTFVSSHQFEAWDSWTQTPETLTRRLHQALPATFKD
jgi:hypothetical protein